MIAARSFSVIIAGAGAIALAGCSTGGPPPMAPRPAVFTALGLPAAYLNTVILQGYKARRAKMRAAKIRPLPPAEAAQYLRQTADEFRRQTAGTGIDVIDYGGGILIRIPSTLTFNSGSSEIAPQIRGALHELARTLRTHERTFVDVYAHSDSTGSTEGNAAISEKRAKAVANFLANDGVAKARIASKGLGESALLYNPDDDETKRAANRRVEIRLAPYTG